jgi:hypothetical protein
MLLSSRSPGTASTPSWPRSPSTRPHRPRSRPCGPEASPRFLTFTSADLTIELEIGPDAIIGQIVPPQADHADAWPARGAVVTAPIDDIGCFIIRPRPTSPFRLHCHADSGVSAQTTWITL